ncbi:MAG: leucine-rich repeat protein [Acutalibacteraceae bacterium]
MKERTRQILRQIRIRATALLIICAMAVTSMYTFTGMDVFAATYSGTCGNNLTWTFDESSGLLTIFGNGAIEDDYYFEMGDNVKALHFNGNITSISDSVFEAMDMSNVALPDSVKYIGSGAFESCLSLTSVIIPVSVTCIDSGAFYRCFDLTDVYYTGSEDDWNDIEIINDSFMSSAKVHYNYNPAISGKLENGFTWSLDKMSGVLTIKGNGALQSWSDDADDNTDWYDARWYITKVVFDGNITEIGDWALYDCPNLVDAVIPASVTSIGKGAFHKCNLLKRVYYSGSETDWKNIAKKDSNTVLDSAEICSNYGTTTSTTNSTTSTTATTTTTTAATTTITTKAATTTTTVSSNSGQNSRATVNISVNNYYSEAYEVLKLVNEERSKVGLSKLTMDASLLDTAMLRASETAIYFSHTRPNGESCFTAFPSNSYAFGENIAVGQTDASDVMNSWMNSSGHKANILGESFKTIGIGCVKYGYKLYWVQCFGTGLSSDASVNAYKDGVSTPTIEISSDIITFKMDDMNLNTCQSRSAHIYVNNGWVNVDIDPSNFIITSSNSSVASVNSNGVVSARYAGNVTLTARLISNNSINITSEVTVTGSAPVRLPVNVTVVGRTNNDNCKVVIAESPDNVLEGKVLDGEIEIPAVEGKSYTIIFYDYGCTMYVINNFVLGTDKLPETIEIYAGDINGDNIINAKDSAILSAAFGTRKGSDGFNSNADLNGDGIINAKDKAILSANFTRRSVEVA